MGVTGALVAVGRSLSLEEDLTEEMAAAGDRLS